MCINLQTCHMCVISGGIDENKIWHITCYINADQMSTLMGCCKNSFRQTHGCCSGISTHIFPGEIYYYNFLKVDLGKVKAIFGECKEKYFKMISSVICQVSISKCVDVGDYSKRSAG